MNRLVNDVQPATDLTQHLLLMLRNHPVRLRIDIHRQATMLCDDVQQVVDGPIQAVPRPAS
jgi:hypothetical protein